MRNFFFSLLLGLMGQAAPESKSGSAQPPPAPAAAPRAVPAPAQDGPLAAAPVTPTQAAQARSAIRHETEARPEGRLLHRFVFPDGATVEFTARPRTARDQARRERVVAYVGTQKAADEPESTFEAAGRTFGLSPEAVTALRYISRHEGGFDAINTWDRARFSWGFIQFAGGYGLRPALAHFKSSSPELFRELLGRYGVDVLPGPSGPEPVYVDPASGRVLRGDEAEQAYGDDPLVIALFIRAGRAPEVKQRQVEAAIRDYAAPALAARYGEIPLSRVLRSPQGLATLIDRMVHEGTVERLEWALEHARIVRDVADPRGWPGLEAEVLDRAIEDADARSKIRELAEAAAAGLTRASEAARARGALPPNGSLAAAREALQQALDEANYRMVVSYRRDNLREGFASALAATEPAQIAGASAGALAERLEAEAARVRDLVSRFRFEYAIRDRLRGIRASELPGPARQ